MMIPRPDLLAPDSPADLEVFQVTNDNGGSNLLYPDQRSFLTEGRYVHHGPGGLHLADPEDDFASRLVIESQKGRGGFIVSPDERHVLYFERLEPGGDSVALRQFDTHTDRTETLMVVDHIPGTDLPGSRIRGGGGNTISSDGRRMATLVWLGDGETPNAPFGIVVLDLDEGQPRLIFQHPEIPSAHLQYCQSPDPDAGHDLMVQMAHGCRTDEKGKLTRLLGPPSDLGGDIHVIRDDGTRWRDMPWGRDGEESIIGHQLWRGTGTSAVSVMLENDDTTYGHSPDVHQQVIEGWPVPGDLHGEHLGARHPGARRHVLSEGFENPRFCHLYITPDGRHFTFDTFDCEDHGRVGMRIYTAYQPDPAKPLHFTYLLNTGSSVKGKHVHPVLSPGGRRLYFNATVTGRREIYMAQGPGLNLPT